VLIVAGSVNYTGAATLAGTAATRVGTGLVTLGLPIPIQPAVAAHLIEATYLLLPHDLGVISSGAVEAIQDKAGEYDALLVGPGLTQEEETVAFVQKLLGVGHAGIVGSMGFVAPAPSGAGEGNGVKLPPLVLDADALNALARVDHWWESLPLGTILTPHPGEMARLMGCEAAPTEVSAHREETCRRMADRWGVVVVLKGAFTVVAEGGGRVMVIPFANPGLATAGSGDVLAGAIAGLRAQGMEAFQAAVAGAYVHGLAGELARANLGAMGMVAGDVALRLPLALRRIRE
jgi:NAD(P)H-hydrate epimerase